MRCTRAVCLLIVVCPVCRAGVISPINVLATSEFGAVEFLGLSDVFATDLIDGGGLLDVEETPDNILDDLHDNDAFWTNGWHSGDFGAGIPGGLDNDGDPFTAPLVDQQVIEFDLGGLVSVTHLHVWQQNQSGLATHLAPMRGVAEFDLLLATEASGNSFQPAGRFQLEAEEGTNPVPAQVVPLANPVVARRIRFDINSAHSGDLNEFVGLAEVRFEGEPIAGVRGDFDGDGDLTATDIERLSAAVRSGGNPRDFDLNGDRVVDSADRTVWVEDLKRTYFGDSNLDGEFNSTDFVVVFQAGEYEDATPANSTWSTGDWNGDSDFTSGDFVIAFQSRGYEVGPRPPVAAVPEPLGAPMLIAGLTAVWIATRHRADGCGENPRCASKTARASAV
jgi:hypothetical protein